ncbi:uncharacterized protein RJT21DRAFT_125073 [Scheffersomyces amazonensis]|uniref:uncharacterized protein n=1 Tax=Scheffersomyces amazonensis TaxID=1078765 RepID=UPI00315CAD2E
MSKVSIAVIGLSGLLGKPFLEAINSGKFDEKIQYPIKALTTKDIPSTEKVSYIKTELNDESIPTIASSLKGVDVIVELVAANPVLFPVLEKVVAEVKPKVYIPSGFGVDLEAITPYLPGFLSLKHKHLENGRKIAGVKTVDFVTSFFAAPGAFLYEYVGAAGINPADKTVTVRGSVDQKFSFSSLVDIGYSLVSLITLPFEKIPETIRINSGVITVQDVIDKYEANHDVKLSIVKTISKEEALKELLEVIPNGEINFFTPEFTLPNFFLVANVVLAQGAGKGAYLTEVDNELVNPGEKYWKWAKY